MILTGRITGGYLQHYKKLQVLYIWRLSFRAFVILTGEITAVYIYLEFQVAITAGYYSLDNLRSLLEELQVTSSTYSFPQFTTCRAFVILTGRITGGYLYLQHYKRFAPIPGGYNIWLILTGEITAVYIYLQHPKKFASGVTIPGAITAGYLSLDNLQSLLE